MREAKIVRIEPVPIGTSRPMRAHFAPGGPVESAAWKTQPPGTHRGHPDNYKAEVAAYELDKLLDLRMVPPSVETRVNGALGALSIGPARRECGTKSRTSRSRTECLERSGDPDEDVR